MLWISWDLRENRSRGVKRGKKHFIAILIQNFRIYELEMGSAIECKRWTISEIDGRLYFNLISERSQGTFHSEEAIESFNFQFPFVIKIQQKLNFPLSHDDDDFEARITPNSQHPFASIVKRQCITIFIVFIPGNKKINGMSRVLAWLGSWV